MCMQSVEIVEVSPRDGLQNETVVMPTQAKAELIRSLAASGVRRIEATSFVNPARVPQLADADALCGLLPRGTISWSGLVLNERGLDRAIRAGLDEVNVVVVATDTFSRRNQGVTVSEAIAAWSRIASRARAAGLRTTVTVAAAFGCPFEGEVAPDRVAEVLSRCVQAQPDEVALADTIGVGVPAAVRALADVAADVAPGIPVRWHFHNTRNTGYANAITAVERGAAALDASAGGIGGCPFAPAATGNIATEDLLYLLDRSGVHTGVSAAGLAAATSLLTDALGSPVPGLLTRAGRFPQRSEAPRHLKAPAWCSAHWRKVRGAMPVRLVMSSASTPARLARKSSLRFCTAPAISGGVPCSTLWRANSSGVTGTNSILSVLGLLLALLAWPGIQATAGLILSWNARQLDLVERNPALSATMWGLAVRGPGDRRVGPDQWRSMLFFRAAPGLFALVWTTLTVIALVIHH